MYNYIIMLFKQDDVRFLTWLSESVYSCNSPVAAAIPITAFPESGTWHLCTHTKKRKREALVTTGKVVKPDFLPFQI